MKKRIRSTKSKGIIATIAKLQKSIERLPKLSEIDRAKLDHDTALSHLYYSSRVEGTKLTNKQIERAIHGEKKLSSG